MINDVKGEYTFYTIHNGTKTTKKELEEFVILLNKGYEVVDSFSFENEQYFVLHFCIHADVEELN